ncbi:MAG TPA: inositol monophosphatase family protein [Casimicrobiaceae bacterium]|nr:inositol monophosphatase family protein [Casimicrobiaceae bacterium]
MTNDPVLAVAIRAAHRAASVILDAARDLRRRPSHAKDHGDVATEAQTEAENAIIATLRAAFPDQAIVGAEAGEIVSQIQANTRESQKSQRWIIDPIDGTANFVHGYPFYAVSIALTHGADVTHAVVLDPVRDELFTAIKGKGAQLNGAAIRTSTCVRVDEALVGTVFPSRSSAKLPAYLPIFNALLAQCGGVRRAGAGALDLAYVAGGRLDGFFVMSQNAWDIAAGALIVTEAGGRIGDFAGGKDFLRSSDVIAAAPGLFNPLRETIAAATLSR